MWTKYSILIFCNLFMNSVIGYEHQRVSIDTSYAEMIYKLFADKLEIEINKLKEKIEERFEQNSIKNLEEKLKDNLIKKLEKKFEDKFEKKQKETEEWVMTSLENVKSLSSRAVVGGYEPDGSPLWITKRTIENNLIPGKLNINILAAYYGYETKEYVFNNKSDKTWVLCAPPEKVRWVECRKGVVPSNAVVGGHTDTGEKLYIGRAKEKDSLVPGQVYPSKQVL